VPAERADMMLGMFRAARAGEFAAVDPTLERLLGKRPIALHEVLREAVGAPVR
jgi:NAD(P)H dehydrogenase (quinone)